MEVASEIMKHVVQVLMVPVKEHMVYLISYRSYVEEMHTRMRELNVARDGETDHLKRNTRTRLEVPAQVISWLEEVEHMNQKVADFPREVLGCLHLKGRHKIGRKASKIIKEIDSVAMQQSLIQWTDLQIPTGRIDSTIAATSQPPSDRNDFKSRESTYNNALKALGPNHKPHMVALWGMGGVGKTTMMKKLKQAVVEKNMFTYYVEAVIGYTTDPIAIQEAVADYLGIKLTESTKPARADNLRNWFAKNSDGGKKKFLVILDDVWQSVDLEDIGLSRLPNQGVDFKVLITSRDQGVCTEMGVAVDSIFIVRLLELAEARSLFRQFSAGSYDHVDNELHTIEEDIVRKCCGLPIAIKTMACTLTGKSKGTWKNALSRLENHDIKTVSSTVFRMSYENLQDEEVEAIFLLCGLFPEDFNIRTEDLLRYGWGLKIFKGVGTIREARYRLNACIERLMHTNLLISEFLGFVKMHDLVRAFVLDMFLKVEHASIVNHGSKPGWPEKNYMSTSCCKSISLTCKGMSEFPSELEFPNLLILKLMHGDESLRFPPGFYGQMEKLLVISYNSMKYPLLPSLPHQCSTNIRVLRLHQCSFPFDFSSIGNLLNLEVLSITNSPIESLPSTVGNLKKLRVLDVRYCDALRIDIVVFKNLVKLEELYTKVMGRYQKAVTFTGDTGDNCYEVGERWKNLKALEFEFYRNDAHWRNLSFESLEPFKIAVGCTLAEDPGKRNKHLFGNTLKLVTNKSEVLGSGINYLFVKTEVLQLSVDDMNDLEDVGVKSSHPSQSSSFYSLRVLLVSNCDRLKYLFTPGVAKVLSKLEHLEVFDCLVMKELIHIEGGGEERVTFPNLKFLSLSWLPELSGLCCNVNIIELPQLVELKFKGIPNFTSIYPKNTSATSCLLKEEVVIPKLEKLHIERMNDLKEIWPCDFRTSEKVELREIKVNDCDNLVNLFPCNPMALLHHLEELQVEKCGSIEVLFNIDLKSVGEIGEEGGSSSSSLKRIKVYYLRKLREVWRLKGGENNSHFPIGGFQAVESLTIETCELFTSLFTPTATNFDLPALIDLNISGCIVIGSNNGLVPSSREVKTNVLSMEETSQVTDGISYASVFPSSLIHSFHNLRQLNLNRNIGLKVVFEIESNPQSKGNQQGILPYLEELDLCYLESMSHVWKCNWNELSKFHKNPSKSPFNNLTTIHVKKCNNIKYLFSTLMAKLLSNTRKINIEDCYGLEEIVSHRDDEDEENTTVTSTSTYASTALFLHLDSLTLDGLRNLKCYGGVGVTKSGNNEISFDSTATTTTFLDQHKFSQVDGVSWTLCQYPREISIKECHALSSAIPCYAAGKMIKLQVLNIESCHGLKKVFETERINNNFVMLELANLKILKIVGCNLLEHIFTYSTLETLRQLKELWIENCKEMKVIVVEEQTMASSFRAVVFPRLNSIKLKHLPCLVGFFLGTNQFQWLSLDQFEVVDCPQMTVFTTGGSTAPQLQYVETRFAKYSAGREFYSLVTTTTTQQRHEITSSSCPVVTSGATHIRSFHNLIELHVKGSSFVEKVIVPFNELLHLQKLEKIHVSHCNVVEVFEVLEGTNNTGCDESPTIVNLPNLTQVNLECLDCLTYMWKTNRWTIFEFPNLTTVSIFDCHSLQHVFTRSMVGSLMQLQKLTVHCCKKIEDVIVDDTTVVVEERYNDKMNEVVLPCLKYLELAEVPCLKGFFLGKEDFSFPSLDTLTIRQCPAITTFTKGNSFTPKLNGIKTGFGWFYAEGDINSFIMMKEKELRRDKSQIYS